MGMPSSPDQELNLVDLPYKTAEPLYKKLNNNKKWQDLLVVTQRSHRYHLSDSDISEVEGASEKTDGCAKMLLRKLGSRGMKLKSLNKYLAYLHLDWELEGLAPSAPMQIVSQPWPAVVSVMKGAPWSLTIKVTGSNVKMEWYKGDTPTGVEGPVYSVSQAEMSDAGKYICRVDNGQSYIWSRWSKVEVSCNPHQPQPAAPVDPFPSRLEGGWEVQQVSILEHPVSACVMADSEVTLRCYAHGVPPPLYQWYKDGQPLPGATSPVLTIQQCRFTDHGSYSCHVHNTYGLPVMSQPATLHVSSVPQDMYPRIRDSPRSQTQEKGGWATFEVVAECQGPLQYQWLHNGIPIQANDSPRLLFQVRHFEDGGRYQCKVISTHSGHYILSQEATLTVPSTQRQYTAEDKFFLGIVNSNYRGVLKNLPGTETDLLKMTQLMSKLGFKVLALIDLTKQEMMNALSDFCDLLDRGVYGVFYFGGHGYQYNNEHYLIGVDAKMGKTDITEHVPLTCVLEKLQNKEPDLSLMMLDMCRSILDYVPNHTRQSVYRPKVTGKTCVIYATGRNQKSYEITERKEGIFVNCIEKVIKQKCDIRELFRRIQDELNSNDEYRALMCPEVQFDLNEARTLHDPIVPTRGHTYQMDMRWERWKAVMSCPSNFNLKLACGVRLRVDFLPIFSNKLEMRVTVCNHDESNRILEFDLVEVNPQVKGMRNNPPLDQPVVQTRFYISELHHLRTSLTAALMVRYSDGQEEKTEYFPIDMGMPMAAIMRLWRPNCELLDGAARRRDATENEYPFDTDQTDSGSTY